MIWLVEVGRYRKVIPPVDDISADPQLDKDAINKQYLEKSHAKPSHYNNEFKYLMTNKLRWTDLQADSFDITKIDNLCPKRVTTINTTTKLYSQLL